jgi:hypothetical protein
VDEPMAEVVQVDALGRNIGGYKNPDR